MIIKIIRIIEKIRLLFQNFNRFGFRVTIFFEAGAAVIFFGSLIHNTQLVKSADTALIQLKEQGYIIPSASEPVKVYPEKTSDNFSAVHAAGWRFGAILLREEPKGGICPEIYLRHELMHEASFRTCGGKLPLWIEEASAINFSGELSFQISKNTPTNDEMVHFRERVKFGSDLDLKSYQTLSNLIKIYDWPNKPCEISEDISKIINSDNYAKKNSGFSYILISILSGRIYESFGDMNAKFPPGSLLKIPYAASLKIAQAYEIGQELSRSDTQMILKRRPALDLDRYRIFISIVKNSLLEEQIKKNDFFQKEEKLLKPLLGYRNQDGLFPFEANMYELCLLLRASLLFKPEYFYGLSENGFIEGSTLYSESGEDKQVLRKIHAMSKTGTITDARGNPLVGHLMVAWPAESPVFLALFRTTGGSGAVNIRSASKVLEKWSEYYPPYFGKVRVRLFSLIPKNSWNIVEECQGYEKNESNGEKTRISFCGDFKILSSIKGSRKERKIKGVLKSIANDNLVLETDPETYADAVMSAEASDIDGQAGKAMRGVVVWNALHGQFRHPETSSLCDTTHCMVFMGNLPFESNQKENRTDHSLLELLDRLALKNRYDWLMFSKGGNENWEKEFSYTSLKQLLKEPEILEIRRERTKKGDILIHLIYPETEEVVPCEIFRNKLKLPACPQKIRRNDSNHNWFFEGIGQGHGLGLSVERAKEQGKSGYDAAAILLNAYDK